MKEIRRIMVFGAHPDDPDICCGGLALKLTRAGHLVKFVSMTNGDRGHYAISGPELAARRLAEAKAARAISGIAEYQVMDHHDCELEVNVANRCEVIRLIRRFAPDVVITHRPCDYHADHRATAQLVLDASYMIRVPQFCVDTPIPEMSPIFVHPYDRFTDPRPIRPDVMIPIDDVMDEKCRIIDCHVSQIYEWLAWEKKRRIDLAQWTWEQKKAYILENWGVRNVAAADLGRARLIADLGEAGKRVRYAEAYEWSPYGCRNSGDVEELRRLLTV